MTDLEKSKWLFADANIDYVETHRKSGPMNIVEITVTAGSSDRVKGYAGSCFTFTFDAGGLLHYIGIGDDG